MLHKEAAQHEGTGTARAARVMVVGYAVLTASLLAIGYLLTHVLDHSVGNWDNHVNRWFVSHRNGVGNAVSGVATFMLNTFPVIGVALIVVLVLLWRHRRSEAIQFVLALFLEITVFLSVTYIVARPRPDVPRLNSSPSTSSFPSGHTAAAIVLYGGIALVVHSCTRNRLARVVAWVVAIGVVVMVAVSRVYRGLHHPTDVMAGAIFGAACLWIATVAEQRRSEAAAAKAEPGEHDGVHPVEPIEWDVVA